jgi:hypothetical protein
MTSDSSFSRVIRKSLEKKSGLREGGIVGRIEANLNRYRRAIALSRTRGRLLSASRMPSRASRVNMTGS